MPVRHNTGGEFPPASGKKWLGVQFNNNDVLVNVYGGKYSDKNGRRKTRRFYGGRFKRMRPALESVVRTLREKIKSGQYSAHEEKWGLGEKLERAKIQLVKYSQEVTECQEAEGLRRLNITSKKRKTRNSRHPRLQSTHPKEPYRIKPQEFGSALSGTLNSGMYVVQSGAIEPFVIPASMPNSNECHEDVKFPMLPPKSPDYWGGAEDGGASDASWSRECSPFYPTPQELVIDESDPLAFGTLLPPKIAVFEELNPATPPLYEDPFDSPLESESSDVDMDDVFVDDFHKSLRACRRSCLNCRIQGVMLTCACEQKDEFSELTKKDTGDPYSPPFQLFDTNGFIKIGNSPSDLLKDDDEYSDEAMMDVKLEMERPWNSSFLNY